MSGLFRQMDGKQPQAKFSKVFYVAGNHEHWVSGGDDHPIEKFWTILSICGDIELQNNGINR
jgi:hypothetical protein